MMRFSTAANRRKKPAIGYYFRCRLVHVAANLGPYVLCKVHHCRKDKQVELDRVPMTQCAFKSFQFPSTSYHAESCVIRIIHYIRLDFAQLWDGRNRAAKHDHNGCILYFRVYQPYLPQRGEMAIYQPMTRDGDGNWGVLTTDQKGAERKWRITLLFFRRTWPPCLPNIEYSSHICLFSIIDSIIRIRAHVFVRWCLQLQDTPGPFSQLRTVSWLWTSLVLHMWKSRFNSIPMV
jgi:hypothetical protein